MGRGILYLAFFTSIIGLLILAYVSETIEPPLSTISQLDSLNLGKNVRIAGSIIDIHTFDGDSILLKIADETAEVDVYLPYNVAKDAASRLKENQRLQVIGEIQVYDGRLEVVLENPQDLKIL